MLRLDCPYCGTRDETEFRYGGEAGRVRPAGSESSDWARYLYWRGNLPGTYIELWLHVSGCRRSLQVVRDTRTNLIVRVSGGSLSEREPAAQQDLEATP